MHCRVRYLLDFDLKIRSGQVCILTTNAQGEITKRQNTHVHCVNLFVGMQEDVLVCVF